MCAVTPRAIFVSFSVAESDFDKQSIVLVEVEDEPSQSP